jgi:hypothetical protein
MPARCQGVNGISAPRLHMVRERTIHTGGSTLTDQSQALIHAAVKECLVRCYQGGTPLGVLGAFIAELREKGWSEPDIRQVELAVRKVLAGVMRPDNEA